VSLADLSDNKAGIKDITNQVKLTSGNSQAAWKAENVPIGKYQLIFNIDGFSVTTPTITAVDRLVLSQVQYQITQSSTFPKSLETKLDFPSAITSIKQL